MSKLWTKKFRNILITGMPASGKSTFAKAYAYRSGRYYLDFDHFIEANTRRTILNIFSEDGEEGFRNIEARILQKLERRHNFVISLGGGTLLKTENLAMARHYGLIIYLKTPADLIAQRIWNDEQQDQLRKRPLFSQCSSLESTQKKVFELLSQRERIYEQADVILETGFSTQDNLTAQLELIERKANNPDYMKDIYTIMDGRIRESKWNIES